MNHTMKMITALITLLFCRVVSGTELHVAPDGVATNSGAADSPLTFPAAIEKARGMLKTAGPGPDGLTISLKGGEYRIDKRIELGAEFKGTADAPIVIRAVPGETVLFDGGLSIGTSGFKKVTSGKEVIRLAKTAKDQVVVKQIKDPALVRKLSSQVVLNLNIGNKIYLPACYPNEGYARFKQEYAVAEVSPPAIPSVQPKGSASRAGQPPWQEPGKPNAWKGSITEPRGAQAGIGLREDEMAGSWKQWAREINGNNTRNLLTGFISADWLLESHPIYSVSGIDQTIHLSRCLAYGWHGPKHKRKDFKVYGLLCELDQPGEWHFDSKTRRFYLYPPEGVEPGIKMGFPYAAGFMILKETEHVSIIGLNVRNVGSGTVFDIRGGASNLIAGCEIRNCTAKGINIGGGTFNGAVSCDLIDLDGHVNLAGGVRSPTELTPAGNYVKNCHMYQVEFTHAKVGIGMSGVGNVFANNLIHNSIGQAMMIRGNGLVMERNEFFNIGFDEGDGGAMYSGADLGGYGNTYRHNFIHHLIHVPGKVTRAGIHLDDLQAGAILTGNVFYKSAEKGIFMNAGAGHVMRENVFLEGSLGIYNVAAGSQLTFDRQNAIDADPNHDLKGNKEDYVGNTEKVVGKDGWNNEPWKSKYPVFAEVMNDKGQYGRLWPIRCVVDGNLYYGNGRGDHAVWSRFPPEAEAKSVITNEVVVSPDWFVDYDALDLRFSELAENPPVIPFEEIGLHLDKYRDAMPDKQHYRMAVKDFFKDVKSMPGSNKQINTGAVVETGPVIHSGEQKEEKAEHEQI